MTARFACALSALALLAACGSDPEMTAPEDDDRSAEGQVLGGTISDEMLPLDTLRSQSPPERRSEAVDTTSEPAPGETPSGEEDNSVEDSAASEPEEAVVEENEESEE